MRGGRPTQPSFWFKNREVQSILELRSIERVTRVGLVGSEDGGHFDLDVRRAESRVHSTVWVWSEQKMTPERTIGQRDPTGESGNSGDKSTLVREVRYRRLRTDFRQTEVVLIYKGSFGGRGHTEIVKGSP